MAATLAVSNWDGVADTTLTGSPAADKNGVPAKLSSADGMEPIEPESDGAVGGVGGSGGADWEEGGADSVRMVVLGRGMPLLAVVCKSVGAEFRRSRLWFVAAAGGGGLMISTARCGAVCADGNVSSLLSFDKDMLT